MRNTSAFIILAIFALFACKKNNTQPESSEPNFSFFNGTIGINDNSTIASFDNDLIICGNTTDKISVIKTTIMGLKVWRTDFSVGSMSFASAIVEAESGDLFICGYTRRNWNNSRIDILLIKTNAEGDTLWTTTYGGQEDDYGRNIIETSDGNLLISAKTGNSGAGTYGDLYLLKIDFHGDTLWTQRYLDSYQELPYSLIETKDNGYLVTGTNQDNSNLHGLYLFKCNSNGEKIWDKTLDAGMWKWAYSTIELTNGDLLTCGQYAIDSTSQILVLKTDHEGNLIWEKEYGEDKLSENGYSIRQDLEGSFTITGSSYDANTLQHDIVVLKINEAGDQVWFKKFGSSESDWGKNLIKETNDDNIITGNYNGNIFLTRIDKDGNYR